MDRALALFGGILGLGIVLVLSSSFITALQDYTMIIVAAMFLAAGIVSTLAAGMDPKKLGSSFINGLISVLPAVLMILMASSIKYTLTEGKILDTILYYAVAAAGTLPRWVVILFLYLVVLVMNFFIPSGSAKAFLLLPLILPVAQIFELSPQLCVMAYAFGDGFSNVLYPTNPVLLISLGLAGGELRQLVQVDMEIPGGDTGVHQPAAALRPGRGLRLIQVIHLQRRHIPCGSW